MLNLEDAKGFIFDCDGTLLDSLGAWDEAEAPLFAQTGPLTQEQEDEIHSAPIERAAELFHEKYGVGKDAGEVLARLDGCLLPFYREQVQALPGAYEAVRYLFDHDMPLVVLSSSPRRYLEAGLSHVGLLTCFKELVTTDEVGVSKQDPAIYTHALGILGCDSSHAWAVDDAPYAISVMGRFGLNTVAVCNGCVPERRNQLELAADICLESLSDFIGLWA